MEAGKRHAMIPLSRHHAPPDRSRGRRGMLADRGATSCGVPSASQLPSRRDPRVDSTSTRRPAGAPACPSSCRSTAAPRSDRSSGSRPWPTGSCARERTGNDVIVVVSAMGHTTDELLAMAHEIAPIPDPRELDMLLTAGERIAMSLLGIAINARGCRAASYTGSQAGIMTDTSTGREDRGDPAQADPGGARRRATSWCSPGSRGWREQYEITTLGRGGSDLTAVAMAGAIGAEVCEIYTDVARRLHGRPPHRCRARASSTW